MRLETQVKVWTYSGTRKAAEAILLLINLGQIVKLWATSMWPVGVISDSSQMVYVGDAGRGRARYYARIMHRGISSRISEWEVCTTLIHQQELEAARRCTE